VQELAAGEGWQLEVTGAGEFEDARYRDNPTDRCYFCKTNLYDRIAHVTEGPIASGANLDDLGDYRPGLIAAAEHRVRHPFVEAGMSKAAVRALARGFDLADISELPAQPCLSSRVETGIAISARDLAFVARMERALAPHVPQGTDLRCRVTHGGIVVEAPEPDEAMRRIADALCAGESRLFLGFRPYRRGAAFLHGPPPRRRPAPASTLSLAPSPRPPRHAAAPRRRPSPRAAVRRPPWGRRPPPGLLLPDP